MIAHEAYFILYVKEQTPSASYYRKVLNVDPIVDVPGITEFRLRDGSILAIMPLDLAGKLLGPGVFGPSGPSPVPKAELYLVVDDPVEYHRRALASGGAELSPMQARNWGHRAAYSVDRDGHVLAFAEKTATDGNA